MTEQVLDVKGSLRLLRRFWKTVGIFALVGLLVAAGYELSRGQTYEATALVLLPGSSSASSGSSQAPTSNDLTTDARIATSAAVLSPAGHQVDPSLSLPQLQARVSTTESATGVLGIVASGPTARQAEALANAVAHHLVSFVTSTATANGSAAVASLQAEANQLDVQATNVQNEINAANARIATEGATSSSGAQDASLVGQLTSELANLNLQINSVKSQIVQTQLGQVSANQGTEVIQQASNATSSQAASVVTGVLIGLVAGALLGSIVVLGRHRRDARLFTRDEIAEAVGSPVSLSLQALGKRSTTEWVDVLEHYQPAPSEQWNVRKALRELGVVDGGATHLVVATLADDALAVTITAQVALAAASSRLETVFSLVDDDSSVPALHAACTRFELKNEFPRDRLEVTTGMPPRRDPAPDLAVTVVVVDPNRPELPEARPGSTTVLAVTAGVATADQLAKVAIAATDGNQPLRGVLVANPASDDQSTGRFPDGGSRASLVLHRRAVNAPRTGAATGRALLARTSQVLHRRALDAPLPEIAPGRAL